jgi:response regulator RpfG family c-di-GMP phosphodiesterase
MLAEDPMETENKIKILLVDDEVKFLKAISERLSLKGLRGHHRTQRR